MDAYQEGKWIAAIFGVCVCLLIFWLTSSLGEARKACEAAGGTLVRAGTYICVDKNAVIEVKK